MKARILGFDPVIVTFVALMFVLSYSAGAQGTAFTYQGRLADNSTSANGYYDLRFALFATVSGGTGLAGPLINGSVGVTNGLFTVMLDFGDVFNGNQRWLEIGVRTNGSTTSFSVLAPRQLLTPTPYAITASNLTGTLATSQLSGVLPSSHLSGTYAGLLTFNNPANGYVGTFSGNGSGLTGVVATPSGVAGGDLAGVYPSPLIANNAVTSSKIANGQVVRSLNSLEDAVSITAGANIAVATVGNSVQISATGGPTLTSLGIKSGTVTGATGSQFLTANIAFSAQYPNANYSISVIPRRASSGGTFLQPSVTYTNKSATGFTVVIFASSTSSVNVTADWITVPYNN